MGFVVPLLLVTMLVFLVICVVNLVLIFRNKQKGLSVENIEKRVLRCKYDKQPSND